MAHARRPVFSPRRIEERVRAFMREHAMWPDDGGVLVAVSGGPDSSALLLLLQHLARGKTRLVAAHFDHRLRGEAASRREHAAVEELARRCGVELIEDGADVAALAREGRRSVEEAARLARYAFLARAARATGCSTVVTGHTLDDQAETVLMHVVRGAGLRGLAGLAPKSPWPFAGQDGLTLGRPLLSISHSDTLAYCRATGVEPVEDESNASITYTRNRVRLELLPVLRTFNPDVAAAFARLAETARRDLALVDALTTKTFSTGDASVSFHLTELKALDSATRHYALRTGVVALLGEAQGWSSENFEALDQLATRSRTGDRLDLPRGVVAQRTRTTLDLSLRQDVPPPGALPVEPCVLEVPGCARVGPVVVGAHPSPISGPGVVQVELDVSAVGSRLVVRRRRPGDRIELANVGAKKLQDLLIDAHIPRVERGSIPVFENEHGIVWVGGVRSAGWAAPRAGASTVVLSYRPA